MRAGISECNVSTSSAEKARAVVSSSGRKWRMVAREEQLAATRASVAATPRRRSPAQATPRRPGIFGNTLLGTMHDTRRRRPPPHSATRRRSHSVTANVAPTPRRHLAWKIETISNERQSRRGCTPSCFRAPVPTGRRRYASTPFTTFPCTSVSRYCRPWKRNVSRS